METLLLVAAVFLSGALVIICIPPIVRIVKAKNLCDIPDERKVHKKVIPTMGGIAIFIGISISTLLLSTGYPILNERIVFAAMILLLFIGISFLVDWLYETWFRLPKDEYLVIALIVIVILVILTPTT